MIRFSCVLVVAFAALLSAAANAQSGPALLDEVVEAYGGAAALSAVKSVEYDDAGYFIGRYQSRHTDPPHDRLPIRTFAALDFAGERAAYDNISTWPGELNMGARTIIDGERTYTLNTISRIYAEGAMFSFDSLANTASIRMPWLYVRRMMAAPGDVTVGAPREHRGITYDTLVHQDRVTFLVHPETRLIHMMETREGGMWDHLLEEDERVAVRRVYTHYAPVNGVMVPRRYQQWVGDDATRDTEIYSVRINADITPHLRMPASFAAVPSMDGYSGDWAISVRELAPGVFVAGGGETRILYVEFDDYFVAMEAGGFPSYAEDVFEAMQPQMNGKPLRYLVPLHHHDDHAMAAHFYARIGATILTTRDKEGFLRRLLDRGWGEHGPIAAPKFEFIDSERLVIEDDTNRLDIHVFADAPHSENMIVGYAPGARALFTGDFYIGWISPAEGGVRQGATSGTRALATWIEKERARGRLGPIDEYVAVHGRAYSAAEMQTMLDRERTITVLPDDAVWPTATWPARYGLHDDTAQNPRRAKSAFPPAFQ